MLLNTPATAASPVGLSPIMASETASPNYVITYVDGILTVTDVFVPVSSKFSRINPQNLPIVNLSHGTVRLIFAGLPGRACVIQFADDLRHPNCQTLGTAAANSVGLYEYEDTPRPAQRARFYRSAYLS